MKNLNKKWLFFLRARDDNITQISIPYALWILALPTSLRFMGHFFFEVVDAFWLGKLGMQALAAVGGVSLYIWSYYAFMLITRTGVNTLVSQAVGAKHFERGCHVAATGICASFLWALFFSLCFLVLHRHLLQMVGLTGLAYHYGKQYFLPFILAAPVYYLWGVLEEIINARGQAQINFAVTLFCLTCNAILDPLLIYGHSIFPKCGIAGAQYASIISACIGLTLTCYYCLRRHYIGKLSLDGKIILEMIRLGIPRVISNLIFCVTYVGLAYIIKRFGQEALAAWMICHRLEDFAYHFSMGFSTAAAVMVGQYFGAAKKSSARKAVYYNIIGLSVVMLANTLLLLIWGKNLLNIFSSEPKVLQYGLAYLTIVALSHIFMGWELVIGGAFSGMGYTRPHLSLVTPLTVMRIPLSLALMPFIGINGVFWAISLTTIIKGIILVIWFDRMTRKDRTTKDDTKAIKMPVVAPAS